MRPQESESLLKVWKSKLGREGLGKRLCLAVVFVVSLSFFLHSREVRVETLETYTTAPQYVLAQVGFEFPDTEATSFLKKEALEDIGKIYRLDEKEVIQKDLSLEQTLVADPVWRDKFPTATFDTMYSSKESLKDILLGSRFVDARTYEKIKSVGLPTGGYIVIDPPERETAALIQRAVWDSLKARGDIAMGYLIDKVHESRWTLQEDLNLRYALRQAVKNSIAVKRTRVEPGGRIINAGEKVTLRHIEMLKAMKIAISAQRNLLTPMKIGGSAMMAILLTILSIIYLRIQHRYILESFSKLILLMTIVLFTLALAKTTEYLLINKGGVWVDFFRYPPFVLFAALMISILFSRELALVMSGFIAVVLGITLAIEYDHFLVVNLVAALVAVIGVRKVRRRKEIFEVCAKVWLAVAAVVLAFNLFENSFWNTKLLFDLLWTAVFAAASAVLVVGLLPILENAFDIVTDMMLTEYVDPNHPLLRRLSVEAPGTYHHSLVVGAISELAAQSIGANGLFCRVATLYHDIGKLVNPQYFTENQFSGFNIHQLLTPLESASVILSHVTEGVALAEKYSLPESFIDVIREHHGTSRVYCFYHAQVDKVGGDIRLVDVVKFTYPGPKPRTKESAIIMIGDTLEAAFRCMEDASEKAVAEMVERLVAEKMEEGQLDACQLSFEELGVIKKSFIRSLVLTRHTRTKYPEKLVAAASNGSSLEALGG